MLPAPGGCRCPPDGRGAPATGAGTELRHTGGMDPTGLSSTTGQIVILAGLLSALVVLIWNWRRRR